MNNNNTTTKDQSKQMYLIGGVMLIIGFLIGMFATVAWYQGDNTADNGEVTATSTDDDTTDSSTDDVMGSEGDDDGFMENTDQEMPDRSGGTVEDENTTESNAALSVTANDQPAGSSVVVSRVISGVNTWIAVREEVNGGMGNILGAKWVPAGEHVNVSINLLRGTEAGSSYFVTLYEDDGDKEFSHVQDALLQVGGTTVFDQFTTTR